MNHQTDHAYQKYHITRITPHIKPFFFPDLWHWRYLIFLFIKRDFYIYFQQTLLGPLWYLLKPLVSTGVLVIIVGRIAKLPTDSIPPFLFYMLGSIIWSYFTDCFSHISQSFSSNTREFGNAAFPRITVPVAAMFSAFIQFTIQFALFFTLYIWYNPTTTLHPFILLLLIPALGQLALIGMGGGMLVAAITNKYRDLSHLTGFCIQLLYLCTPLAYPLSMVKEPYRRFFGFNPLTSIIELFRKAFFQTASLTFNEYCIGWIITISIFATGLIAFNIIEKTFIDTV